jgi:hypothetical protein
MGLNAGRRPDNLPILRNPIGKGLGEVHGLASLGQHLDPGRVLDRIFRIHPPPERYRVRTESARGLRPGLTGFNDGQVRRLARLFHWEKYKPEKA